MTLLKLWQMILRDLGIFDSASHAVNLAFLLIKS